MSDYQSTPPTATPYQGSPSPYGSPLQSDRYNVLAIISFVGAFVVPLAGIICGHIALSQIKRTGERGHGLALWGTILGYAFIVLAILLFVGLIALAVALPGGSASNG